MKDGDRGFSSLFFSADGLFFDDEISGNLQELGLNFWLSWWTDCSPVHEGRVAANSQSRDDDDRHLSGSCDIVARWPHYRTGSWSGLRRLTAVDVRERSSGLLAHPDVSSGFSRASQRDSPNFRLGFDGRLWDLNDFLSPSDCLE